MTEQAQTQTESTPPLISRKFLVIDIESNGRLSYCIPCYDRRQKAHAQKMALPQQQGFNFLGVAS